MFKFLRNPTSMLTSTALAAALLSVPVSFTVAGLTVVSGPDAAYARRGADDGPNHDANDDSGRGGRDGGKGRGRGQDDGPNHTFDQSSEEMIFARRGRGADDGPGHDANDDNGGDRGGKGRGRGEDDPVGHA